MTIKVFDSAVNVTQSALEQMLTPQGETASRESARSSRAAQHQRQLRWWAAFVATALCVGPLMFTIGWFARGNQSTDNTVIDLKLSPSDVKVKTSNSSPEDLHGDVEMDISPSDVKVKTFNLFLEDIRAAETDVSRGDVKVKTSNSSPEDLHGDVEMDISPSDVKMKTFNLSLEDIRAAETDVSRGDAKVKTSNSSLEDLNPVAEVLPGLQSFNSSLESDYIANLNELQSFVDSCKPICKPESIFSGFIDGVPGLGKKYHPDKGVVCRCTTHSGCCSNPKHTCKAIETKWVEPVYNVTHQDGTSSLERLRWENVTRCACLPDEDGPK